MTQSLSTDLKGQQVRLDAVSSVLLELLHQLGGFCKGLLGGCQLLAIWVGILLPVQPGFCYQGTQAAAAAAAAAGQEVVKEEGRLVG